MGLKEALLKKGWAGRTLSRQETVERLNPLIRRLYEVMHAYLYAEQYLADREVAASFAAPMKILRADIGKLSETVFSCGGVAYNGTDLETSDFDLGRTDEAILFNLLEAEEGFFEALEAEKEVEHQMRTRAILDVLRANSRSRLELLRRHTAARRRPAPSAT
ncbi:hypothetical protein GQ464_002095 [Rhodocaloribacter litoris]|uniref:hypothetical protein n=1 Tax=Rhodocaloribacter litoris TaxID=2558931 RepID=UPI001422399D|nr:hypothetical protein [Rhodocaloribacter litoris]QXD15760.1 hypothetical protein GQ464_002095 [Rhodocaloribacter litoris]